MLDKNKTYVVYNYDKSAISVPTRTGSILIPAGEDYNPSGIPFTLDEISYINVTTPAFKSGMLWFDPEYEDDIYEELRIQNYKDIMTNMEIEDIILNPTVDTLESLLAIENPMYFNRVYGIFVGLKNDGASMSSKVADLMKARYEEFANKKRKTSIRIRAIEDETKNTSREVEDLKQKLAEMEAMMQKMMKTQSNTESDKNEVETVKKPSTKKTATKKAAVKEETDSTK